MVNKIPYQTVALIGKTGSGKGTQATLLSKKLGYSVFSTGDRVRETGAQPTSLGKQIQAIQVKGWVPEWLASFFLVKALIEEHPEDGIIFESVARKPQEAEKLHQIHEMLDRSYIVIHLDISDEIVTERMLARCRDEADTSENIEMRLRAFHDETLQSIDIFDSYGKVKVVDASQPEERVFEDIVRAISS